jgi:tocopherol cyclase
MGPLRNILKPNTYHGFFAQPPYFEGWYYKCVNADETKRFAIIPGVYVSPVREKSHCFVQVFDSKADQVTFYRYPFEDFKPSPDSFEVLVGPNYFSKDEIRLALAQDGPSITGHLHFTDLTPWPVRFFSPGAMGWYAWLPFMECYHGVVSMDHGIQGSLQVEEQKVDFTGGRGYIEKDWGKRFPEAWIWGQSNHFDQPGISLMLSVAIVPLFGYSMSGFIIGLLYAGKIIRFATYRRSRIENLAMEGSEIRLVVKNPSYRLHISAGRVDGGLFQAPSSLEMDRRIIETLNATFSIQLEDLQGHLIFESEGRHAGLETVGDLEKLKDFLK